MEGTNDSAGARSRVEILKESVAYKNGWQDGRFGRSGIGSDDRTRMFDYVSDMDRIAYHYGHREGRRIRNILREESEVLSGASAGG